MKQQLRGYMMENKEHGNERIHTHGCNNEEPGFDESLAATPLADERVIAGIGVEWL
jgi:hypothetical protein